jgi:hypothetical protein
MVDSIKARCEIPYQVLIRDGTLDQSDPICQACKVLPGAAREVIKHSAVIPAGNQGVDKVRPNKACPARDECSHHLRLPKTIGNR